MPGTKCHIKELDHPYYFPPSLGYLLSSTHLLPGPNLDDQTFLKHAAELHQASRTVRFPKVGHSTAAEGRVAIPLLSCHWKPFCLPSRVPSCKGQNNK